MTRELNLRALDIPTIHKFGIGFDNIFDELMRVNQQQTNVNYPPYNIIKHSEDSFAIELAVAGFGKQDLTVELKENSLVVSGNITADAPVENYLYKGIADRAFTRKFNLADTVEIQNTQLMNGMLKIFLENIIPESKRPRKIEIEEPTTEKK